MGKKKSKDKMSRTGSEVNFYNDQLGENPAQGRMTKEHNKKTKRADSK